MTPADALTTLSGIALEYTQVLGKEGKPCTQKALMLQIQQAHNVLNGSMAPAEEPAHDRDPT
ncbi:MAG: hypothetical protein ABIQ70_13400 [Dokdonella sp.]